MSQEEEHGAAPSPLQGFAFQDLVDEQPLREITLLIDVISEVSDSRQHLTTDEVDSVLGVRPRAPTNGAAREASGDSIGGTKHGASDSSETHSSAENSQ